MGDEGRMVDVSAVVDEIRAEVARKRAAGAYAPDLLARLQAQIDPAPVTRSIEEIAHLNAVRPISARRGLAGRAIVGGKRVVRRGIAWYVAPIAEDQSHVNFALLGRLEQLERRIANLEAGRGGAADDTMGQ